MDGKGPNSQLVNIGTSPSNPPCATRAVASRSRRLRAVAAYGQHSYVGKILEIGQELPGRIHIVLIRQPAGF